MDGEAGSQKAPGIGVSRMGQEFGCRALLHHSPTIHDEDSLAEVGNDTEIVRDEKKGHPPILLQTAE